MKKVLLDTDIGTEVDDAIALAYLLANPECELLGITTGTGEAVKRAQLASVFCKIADKDIPIHPGCELPLLVPQMEKYAPQASILKNWPHDTDFKRYSAVPFMQQIIHDNPGEVHILAIQPLTNLAALFAIDPEIPSLLAGLTMMCGSPVQRRYDNATEGLSAMDRNDLMRLLTSRGTLENNAVMDPHATSLVYRAEIKNHYSVGINCSSVPVMTPAEAEKAFTHPLLKAVYAIASEWFKDDPRVSMHDPLAAVCLFHDDVVEFETGEVSVELDSKMLSGFTFYRPCPDGRHRMSIKVDEKAFFKHLLAPFT
ncbi:MAG: nucleoside hydrolase [Planctomycetes bacterium]|nr:nucleoside hydrolase [Planctomycetota bacterium]